MSFLPHNNAKKPQGKTRSTWVVAILVVLLLISSLSAGPGGFGVWVLLMGLLLLVTALYSLVFKRASWARLASPTVRKRAVAVGGALTVVGAVVAGMTAPAVEKSVEPVAEASATPSPSKSASPSPTKSVAAVAAGKACVSAGARQTVVAASATPTPSSTPTATPSSTPSPSTSATGSVAGQAAVFICTEDDKAKLVWMTEDDSKKIVAARKETADKEAADKKAAEEAAAAAEQQRLADEAAAAAAAEAQRVADEQAAAAASEAQRVADEQARQQYVAPAPPAAPAPAGPNVVHPGAFCSGGVGVSSTGKPMVCAPAKDGRLRWISAG